MRQLIPIPVEIRALTLSWRPLVLAVIMAGCLACAAGPAPQRTPKDIRLSIRHLNKGTDFFNKGCYAVALRQLEAAHEGFAAADHLTGTAESLNSMANAYFRMGDLQSALAVYDEAVALYRKLEQRVGLVRALTNKAAVLITDRRLAVASATLKQADQAAEKTGILKALRLKTEALLLIARNKYEDAEVVLHHAMDVMPPHDSILTADLQYTLGHLRLTSGSPQTAIAHLEAALQIDRSGGAYYSTAMDLAALGSCSDALGQPADAVGYYKRSMKVFALLGAADKVQQVLPLLRESAGKSDQDIRATLGWAERWLSGQRETNVCR